MTKNKKFKSGEEGFEEVSTSHENERDNGIADNDIAQKDDSKEPLFPFDKMIYQEKGENENDIHEYDMGSHQELNLGESESRTKKRTLRDEKGVGHEP